MGARALPAAKVKTGGRRRKTFLNLVAGIDVDAAKKAALEKMPDQFMDCRDVGHHWLRAGSKLVEQDRQIEQTFVCRCTSKRIRRLTLRGEIISSTYDYADGYVLPTGSGRVTAADRAYVRLKMVDL